MSEQQTSIQVYGEFRSASLASRGVVSRGVVEGLTKNGITCYCKGIQGNPETDVELCELPDGAFHGVKRPDPQVGLFVGGNPAEVYPRVWMHEISYGLLLTESSVMPPGWDAVLAKFDRVVCPSRFCRDVFSAVGNQTELLLCPHGVSEEFAYEENSQNAYVLELIHFAGGPHDLLDRKQTIQLIEAFFAAKLDQPARLTIVIPLTDSAGPILYHNWALHLMGKLSGQAVKNNMAAGKQDDRLCTLIDASMPSTQQSVARRLRYSDALVQPSRSEGFGLLPLQARAVGIPVILTATTGHLDHLDEHDVVIPTEKNESELLLTHELAERYGYKIDPVKVLHNAVCPEVSVDRIVDGLEQLSHDLGCWWLHAQKRAETYQQRWSWEAVTKKLAQTIKIDVHGTCGDLEEPPA